jgi:hypothetical protein
MTTDIVPVSRTQKLQLKDASLAEVTSALSTIAVEDAPTDFPPMPEVITASKEVRTALSTLSKTFQSVTPDSRRTLTTEEAAAIGTEYEALQKALKVLVSREEAIKEVVRTHQDVEAEEAGLAFPKDVIHNGNLVAKATERDAKGHYILASKGTPQVTEIPGSTAKFSNQFASGRTTENLRAIQEMFDNGEIDEAAYKAMTVVKRVPDADKIRAYVLKTGKVSILGRIVRRGRNSSALYLRGLKKS